MARDDGADALDGMIAKLRALGKNATHEAAKEAAPLVLAAAKATAAAGTDPYGKAWPEKKDGGRALPNAAEHIAVQIVDLGVEGAQVQLKTTGPYTINHYRKKPRRQILPIAGEPVPDAIADAMREGARRAFKKLTGA